MLFRYIYLDTVRNLNALDVFWTSHACFPVSRWTIAKSLSLCYLTLSNSILKAIVMECHQKAESANLICMEFVFWSYWESVPSFVMTPLDEKCVSSKCPYDSEVLKIILKLINTKFHWPISGHYFFPMSLENIKKPLIF